MSVSPVGCSPKAKTKRSPNGVRSARKTVRWTVFSGERAAAPGGLCRAEATAEADCELRKRGGYGYPPAVTVHPVNSDEGGFLHISDTFFPLQVFRPSGMIQTD